MRISGLGWCLKGNGFKIYLLFDSLSNVHPDFAHLLHLYPVGSLSRYKDVGLASLTYKDNKLVEHKLYLYRKDELEEVQSIEGSFTYADVVMLSSERARVVQKSFEGPDPDRPQWPLRFRKIEEKLNMAGQLISWKNEAHGYIFDTWSGSDKDNWTIYFPH